jgi:hypothetical protein
VRERNVRNRLDLLHIKDARRDQISSSARISV